MTRKMLKNNVTFLTFKGIIKYYRYTQMYYVVLCYINIILKYYNNIILQISTNRNTCFFKALEYQLIQ